MVSPSPGVIPANWNFASAATFTLRVSVVTLPAESCAVMTTVWAFVQSLIERRLESRGGTQIDHIPLRERLFGGGALTAVEQLRGAR